MVIDEKKLINRKKCKKNKRKNFYIIISLFIIFLSLIIGIYFYDNKIKEENRREKNKLDSIKFSILEKEKNEKIKIYKIYNNNKNLFDMILYRSDIPRFMEHLDKLYYNSNLKFN
jgi:predicted negative regulator of RcsB-dependent stress response